MKNVFLESAKGSCVNNEIENNNKKDYPQPLHPAVFAQQITYSSPLPPPEVLQKYKQIDPELINKITDMTEVQATHRRQLESRSLNEGIRHTKRRDLEANIGQACGFIIAVMGIIAGAYVALQGQQVAGGILGLAGISGIVAVFVNGRKKENT